MMRQIAKVMPRLGARGDTIVEVLICIMLVSIILTGAYVTTNRSTLAVRDSQEHAEALKLVTTQLEQLRQSAKRQGTTIFTKATPFCMSGGQTMSADQQPQAASCLVDSSGAPRDASQQPAYKMTVTREDAADSAVFKVKVTWDGAASRTASEQISYRLYK